MALSRCSSSINWEVGTVRSHFSDEKTKIKSFNLANLSTLSSLVIREDYHQIQCLYHKCSASKASILFPRALNQRQMPKSQLKALAPHQRTQVWFPGLALDSCWCRPWEAMREAQVMGWLPPKLKTWLVPQALDFSHMLAWPVRHWGLKTGVGVSCLSIIVSNKKKCSSDIKKKSHYSETLENNNFVFGAAEQSGGIILPSETRDHVRLEKVILSYRWKRSISSATK